MKPDKYLKVLDTYGDDMKLKLSTREKYNDMIYEIEMMEWKRGKRKRKPKRKNFFKKYEYYYETPFGWGLKININTLRCVSKEASYYYKKKVKKTDGVDFCKGTLNSITEIMEKLNSNEKLVYLYSKM